MKELSHPSLHRTWVEIDLQAIACNIRHFRGLLSDGCQIMQSVASNGCGLGGVEISRAVLAGGAARLSVANCREGQALREAGIGVPIQVMEACLPEEIETAVRYNLIVSLHDLDTARLVALTALKCGRVVPVQMEIDTGQGRLGFLSKNAVTAAAEIALLPGLVFEGVFTHLTVTAEESGIRRQLRDFASVCGEIENTGLSGFIRHAASAAAAFLYPESRLDMVRLGCGMLGFHPPGSPYVAQSTSPVLSWRASVVMVKKMSDHWLAALPVGWADGYRREFSGRAHVLIRGTRAPVVDRVSMNHILADVTGIPGIAPGTVATLLGVCAGERIDISEMAAWANVTPLELIAGIGNRACRRYAGIDGLYFPA